MDILHPRQICSRPSAEQMRALLDELESNPLLARGRTKGHDGRRRSETLWRQITLRLNTISGCNKSHKQWQKFWADKKSAVKKQVAARQAEGLSVFAAAFNDIELRIISLIDKFKAESNSEDGPSESSANEIDHLELIMSNSDSDENPLIELPITNDYMLEVKQEPHISNDTRSKNQNKSRKIRKPPTVRKKLKSIDILRKLYILEKRRSEHERRACDTVKSIAECIKRQEEATQKLTRALLQLIPRHNTYQRRVQTAPPSTEQVTALLDELESNPYLAHGKLRKRSTPLWNAITEKLNQIEGCYKTPKQWMKYWSDKKVAVKRLLDSTHTAAGNNADIIFSDVEHRVLALLESPGFYEQPDFPADTHCMEAEYLDNDDYISDENEGMLTSELQNPLQNIIPVIKPLSCDMKPHTPAIQKPKTKKRRAARPLTSNQMLQKLLRLEEKRVATHEIMSNALDEIETSMRRQEEATRGLAKVLLKLLRET